MESWIEFTFIIGFALLVYLNFREVKKCTNAQSLPLWIVPLLITIFLVMPTLLSILIVFFAFRQLVRIILIIKHGTKFGGLLRGTDAFHFTSKRSQQQVINTLLMFQSTKQVSPNTVYENAKLFVQKMQQFKKFNSKFFSFCGYPYMLKKQLTIDDCIRKMNTTDCKKDKLSKSQFMAVLNECCNSRMPQNNTVPWEVVVWTKPVEWKDDLYNYYPTLFRTEHVIADGVTLLQVILEFFTNGKDIKMISEFWTGSCGKKFHAKVKNDYFRRIKYIFMTLCTQLYALVLLCLLFPYFFVSSCVLKAKDDNILCGPALSGQKLFLINVEDGKEYMEKIKKVKNAFGISFSDVVITAISAILNDFFIKKSIKIDYITASVPFRSGSNKLSHTTPEELNLSDQDIENKYSFLVIKLPVYVGAEGNDKYKMSRRLSFIKKQSNIFKSSWDYQLVLSTIKIMCTCLPRPTYEPILRKGKCTTIISILAGPPKVHCWKNSIVISDIVPFAPQAYGTGTTLLVTTYDERLHISIAVDKALIPDQEDAQKIVDDVLKYIDVLVKYADLLKPTNNASTK